MKESICKECGGRILFEEFEAYCIACGLILEDSPVNFGEESFSGDPEKAAKLKRTGAPITWLNHDFSTTFFSDKNIFHNKTPYYKKFCYWRKR